MKEKLKWIMAGVLCAIGLLLILLSFMFVQFDITKFGKSGKNVKVEKVFEVEDIDKIVVRDEARAIVIKPSLDDKIHITYYENETLKIDYRVVKKNGTLSIQKKAHFMLWQLNPFDFIEKKEYNIQIEVPKQKIFSYDISTVSGKIKVNQIDAVDLIGETTSSALEVQSMKAEKINLSTVSGKITGTSLSTNIATFETTSGKIESHKVEGKTLRYKTVSGRVETEKITTHQMTASTVSGRIILEDLYARLIDATTVSGKIEGHLLLPEKEYSIEVETVSGKSNVVHTVRDTTNKIRLETTSGNIVLSFVS